MIYTAPALTVRAWMLPLGDYQHFFSAFERKINRATVSVTLREELLTNEIEEDEKGRVQCVKAVWRKQVGGSVCSRHQGF